MKPLLQLAPHELEPSRQGDDDLKPNEQEFEFRGRWQGREHDFLVRKTWLGLLPAIFFAFKRERQRGNFVYFPKNDYPGIPEGQQIPSFPTLLYVEGRQKNLQTCCELGDACGIWMKIGTSQERNRHSDGFFWPLKVGAIFM